jgi:predicted nicotinamide N-methyase
VTVPARSFVLRQTRLQAVWGFPDLRLHLADDVSTLWHAVQTETGDPDTPLPYWAFAWSGGLALAHHLRAHPELVAGRRLFDLATGSGLVAIVAAQLGAARVVGSDIDPFAAAAVDLNARANRVRVGFVGRDVLDEETPDVDVVLAGDTWYEGPLARRVLPWLEAAAARGRDVLVGDPGRTYLPTDRLVELARYPVRTTTELEDLAHKTGYVYGVDASNIRTKSGAR